MTFGITGIVPTSAIRRRARKTVPMSSAVGVLGSSCAAIAADFLHVDLASGSQSSVTKVIRVNRRIAASAGLSSFEGYSFVEALRTALNMAPSLEEVSATFLEVCGPQLAAAYNALYSQLHVTPDDMPIQLLVAGPSTRGFVMVEAWTVVENGQLTMNGRAYDTRPHQSVCVAIGAETPILHRTESGRVARNSEHRAIPKRWTQRACALDATRLVEVVINHQRDVPRPIFYPSHLPVAALPVHTETTGQWWTTPPLAREKEGR